MKPTIAVAAAVLCACAQFGRAESPEPLYRETYRPQYHFTPAHRWIGDPCGLIRHNGLYRAYSWGAATSADLVHWTEINDHAILGLPEGTAAFTGSVVADTAGTAGFGRGTLVAAFTSFDEASRKQSQSIAFSHDGGDTFICHDGNPVLDIWSTEFRDPTVIWDAARSRWIMLVARALEKKVAFYASPDLRQWEWLSDFGPLGDSEKSWECPDMFRLRAADGTEKWVLLVSVNWAREQYFIGEFDGTKFTADPLPYPLYVDHGLDYYASRVFQDSAGTEAPVYTIGWLNTWHYAQQAPTAYGKGIWSIPRRYSLVETAGGFRLAQTPAEALRKLRGKPFAMSRRLVAGVRRVPEVSRMGNTYELDVTFSQLDLLPAGIFFCEGDGKRVTLTYDPASRHITLDRTGSTPADIPKFSRSALCALPDDLPSDRLRLRCFVDKSTVEIFVDDGRAVLSLLTYAGNAQTGMSVFSLGGKPKIELIAWPLQSIWNHPTGTQNN